MDIFIKLLIVVGLFVFAIFVGMILSIIYLLLGEEFDNKKEKEKDE